MGDLRETLGQTLADAHRAYAAFRPEVAKYLFERGFKPTEQALGPGNDALLSAVFRLQMETIGSRAFGVSNDGWRGNPGWPDRYFPILWLDLVPQLLPMLPSGARMEALTLLFNLGENLVTVAPALGGAVAESLHRAIPSIARDGVLPAAIAALADLGIIPREAAVAGSKPTAVRLVASIPLGVWDPVFIPGAVGFDAEGTFYVADRVRPIALHLTRAGTTIQLVGRLSPGAVRELAALPCHADRLVVSPLGEVSFEAAAIGRIDPRGIAGAAVNSHGLIVIARHFSQHLELWSAS